MRLSWRGFPIVAAIRSAAHSIRTRTCVAGPCMRRDGEIRFRKLLERPCILTASAGAWSATCRFRCVSRCLRATRSAVQREGEREHAIGNRRGKMQSFGQRCRLKRRACPARTRACERGQRERPCGYPIAETNRGTVYFNGECRHPIDRCAAPGVAFRPVAPSGTRIRARSEDSRPCGYPSFRITRMAVVFSGEGTSVAGRQCRIGRG